MGPVRTEHWGWEWGWGSVLPERERANDGRMSLVKRLREEKGFVGRVCRVCRAWSVQVATRCWSMPASVKLCDQG